MSETKLPITIPRRRLRQERHLSAQAWSRDRSDCYVIQSVVGGPIKIGIARDVEARLRTLSLASPFELRALIVFQKAGREMEAALHVRLRESRLHGEWFKLDEDVIQVLTQLVKLGEVGDEALNAIFKPAPYRDEEDLVFLLTEAVRAGEKGQSEASAEVTPPPPHGDFLGDKRWLTPEEVCSYLGIEQDTLDNIVRHGHLKESRFAKKYKRYHGGEVMMLKQRHAHELHSLSYAE